MKKITPVLIAVLLASCAPKAPSVTGILGASDPAPWSALGFFPVFAGTDAAAAAGVDLVGWTCEPDRLPAELARVLEQSDPKPWLALGLRSWTETTGVLGKQKLPVFPTRRELRFNSYFGMIHGAKGVLFTGVERGEESLLDYPEQSQAVSSVARELAALAPAFSAPGVRLEAGKLAAARWRRLRDFIVIANPEPAPACLPEALAAGDWRPLFEPRRELDRPICLAPRQVLVLEGPMIWEELRGR